MRCGLLLVLVALPADARQCTHPVTHTQWHTPSDTHSVTSSFPPLLPQVSVKSLNSFAALQSAQSQLTSNASGLAATAPGATAGTPRAVMNTDATVTLNSIQATNTT